MLKIVYIVVASGVVGLYAMSGLLGWEYGNPQRTIVPPDARRSPGWAHSGTSHFWYSGYHGGK